MDVVGAVEHDVIPITRGLHPRMSMFIPFILHLPRVLYTLSSCNNSNNNTNKQEGQDIWRDTSPTAKFTSRIGQGQLLIY